MHKQAGGGIVVVISMCTKELQIGVIITLFSFSVRLWVHCCSEVSFCDKELNIFI